MSQRETSSARIGIDASDVVDLVDRLERAGFVRRRATTGTAGATCSSSRRPDAQAIERFEAVCGAVDEMILEPLDDDEQATLRQSLAASSDLGNRVARRRPPR